MISRKKFIVSGITGTSALLLNPFKVYAAKDEKPQLKNELVKEFVGTSHRDITRVVEMHKQYPTLLNAAWDWGGGDFETALGAASHVGYIELVNYLLENGAQMNFLTCCLMGKTDLVKNMLQLYPFLINMKGPHGFTPLHHAIQGETNALEVKEYLESLGAKETKLQLQYVE
ncbi:MAG: ankyrin repeat domain-containing protein [Fimbriimonadaceae bacterium]|nr:ankyrin repeat domain-containing protein [Chitinophagales bacterium]